MWIQHNHNVPRAGEHLVVEQSDKAQRKMEKQEQIFGEDTSVRAVMLLQSLFSDPQSSSLSYAPFHTTYSFLVITYGSETWVTNESFLEYQFPKIPLLFQSPAYLAVFILSVWFTLGKFENYKLMRTCRGKNIKLTLLQQ